MNLPKSALEGGLPVKMTLAVALSYVIDGSLLAGFAATGTISITIPLAYTAIGLFDSALFLLLRAWAVRNHRDQSYALTLANVIASSAILLVFAALAPQMAFYFF